MSLQGLENTKLLFLGLGTASMTCQQPKLRSSLTVTPSSLSVLSLQGLGNTTLFCGDGINDLAALSAADVGMAVGATDAIVAASLSTQRGSVAGLLLDPPPPPPVLPPLYWLRQKGTSIVQRSLFFPAVELLSLTLGCPRLGRLYMLCMRLT